MSSGRMLDATIASRSRTGSFKSIMVISIGPAIQGVQL